MFLWSPEPQSRRHSFSVHVIEQCAPAHPIRGLQQAPRKDFSVRIIVRKVILRIDRLLGGRCRRRARCQRFFSGTISLAPERP